jgi:CheY-like chemotaxis protein
MTQSIPQEVLVVEDDALIRIVAADALADRGIMAWEAADAAEALVALEHHPRIGLVFTDVEMPGRMNGLDLAHQVSQVRPDVGLVVTSGAMAIPNQDLPDHGTFLAKPYPTQRLVDLIAEKLDSPEG